jgi:hypothetical protein
MHLERRRSMDCGYARTSYSVKGGGYDRNSNNVARTTMFRELRLHAYNLRRVNYENKIMLHLTTNNERLN